tara:strand:+ start:1210 stop:2886 length:1677 start_codon:yes stop_codon:yes gene_type:complete
MNTDNQLTVRDDIEIIKLIKGNLQLAPWVKAARDKSLELRALKYGENFHELLINKIEYIENSDRALARTKYSYDVRDLFERVMQPRQNVFSADGGSTFWKKDINEKRKEGINERFTNFKGGKSIEGYLQDTLFQVSDVDPNGMIFLEYVTDQDKVVNVYPTYKSIKDIQNYEPNGLKVDWVLFSPIKVDDGNDIYELWRYVDSKRDVTIKAKGETFSIVEESTFDNDFGTVPATILSNIEEIGSKNRLSWLFFITEMSKKFARDSSVKTIYEFIQGFTKHWRYAQMCNVCKGSGKVDGHECTNCNGSGELGSQDVTDDVRVPFPVDQDDAIVAPNLSGWVSPDLETLKHQGESIVSLEELIDKTMWGTTKEKGSSGRETATGRFIDLQPVTNKLNVFTDFTEHTHNTLAQYVIALVDNLKNDTEGLIYHKDYGRRFIIESPDVLIEKYLQAKKEGAPDVILDRMINEVIMSKYKNDPIMRELMIKKSNVEPYLHVGIEDVNTIFGERNALKKDSFAEWWRTEADEEKEETELRSDFDKWFEAKNPKEKEEVNDKPKDE